MGWFLRHKSFTLAEIIVGAIIVTIIGGICFASAIFSQTLVTRERNRLIALEYINSTLEDLLFEVDFDDPRLNILTFNIDPSEFPQDEIFLKTTPNVSYTVSWYQIDPAIPINPSDPNTLLAKQIDITVIWNELGSGSAEQKTVTLSSIKVK